MNPPKINQHTNKSKVLRIVIERKWIRLGITRKKDTTEDVIIDREALKVATPEKKGNIDRSESGSRDRSRYNTDRRFFGEIII